MPPFHLAIPVHDLAASRAFYGELLGCREGRSSARWVDFDLAGHQVVAHLAPRPEAGPEGHAAGPTDAAVNPVDGDGVPVPHFGLVLPWAEWHALRERLEAAGTAFLLGPRVRFEGQPGEQATMFFRDPSGNALEMKSFRDPARLFAKEGDYAD